MKDRKVPIDKMPQLLIAINHKQKYYVQNLIDVEIKIPKKQFKWEVFPLESVKQQIWDYVKKEYPDCKFANIMHIRKYGKTYCALVDILS